jgi:hypothetical protein
LPIKVFFDLGGEIMNSIICKENENKEFTVSTSEFNVMLKENGVEWEVMENNYTDYAMYTKNYSDKHESFNYTMFKKFDIELETFEYKRIDDKIVSSKINLQFEFCKHSNSYNQLLESDVDDVTDYINEVKRLLKNQVISSHEACYLMESKDLDIILLS